MRMVACSLLLAGCNTIFGLDDNAKFDPAAGDAARPTFTLRYLLADTAIVSGVTNEPTPPVAIGMDDATGIQVGPLDGELVDAPYDVATGEVELPSASLTAAPWRVRYTIGGVDHEVQWQPQLAEAKVIEPLLGRRQVEPPPRNSGYSIAPTGPGAPGPGGFVDGRVFTTGVFLDLRPGTNPTSTPLATPLTTFAGTLGSPDPVAGDAGVVVSYAPTAGCEAVVGYAHFLVPPLVAESMVPVTTTWQSIGSTGHQFSLTNHGAGGDLRLLAALGDRSSGSSPYSAIEHGISAAGLPHALIVERPVVVNYQLPSPFPTVRVPGPHMLVLAQCPIDQMGATFHAPNELAAFPRLTHALVLDSRQVPNGPELVSSLVGVSVPVGTVSGVDLRAPMAIDPITVTPIGASAISLSGATDGVTLPATAKVLLDFAVESDDAELIAAVDQFEVAIFEIVDTTLAERRVFVTTDAALKASGATRVIAAPIPLDLAGLDPGTYVLRIRSIFGTPRVRLGDFETVTSPYSAATVFTRTFTLP